MNICNNFIFYLILYLGIKEYANAISEFELTIDRADVLYYNKSFCYFNMSVSRINRKSKALFLFLHLNEDAPPQTTASIKLAALMGNEYKRLPINIKRNICDSLDMEYQWIKEQVEAVDHKFPNKCPLLKGDYYINGLIPSAKNFPNNANFPWDKMTATFEYSTPHMKIVKAIAYINLDHDAKLKLIG